MCSCYIEHYFIGENRVLDGNLDLHDLAFGIERVVRIDRVHDLALVVEVL
jgi:hypothetical protein